MPGSGGGKTSTSSTSSPYAAILEGIGSQMWRTAKPVYQTYASQAEEALRTGGVNAQIPSVSRAVGAAREQQSQSTTDLRQRLAQSGLAGTSFAQALLQEDASQGGQAVANIPAEATSAFVGQAVPQVLGMGRAGVGAIGQAAGIDQTTTSTPSFWDFFTKGLSAGAQTGGDIALFAGA